MSNVATLLYPCAKTLASTNQRLPSFASPRPRTHAPGRISTFHRLLPSIRHRWITLRCSSDQAAGEQFGTENQNAQDKSNSSNNFWTKWMMYTGEMRSRVAKLGLAAVLAYGLFDGVTYTTFFILAFLGYEKSTGKNPAANLQALLGDLRWLIMEKILKGKEGKKNLLNLSLRRTSKKSTLR
ncbi:uncharacterized protein LOC103714518 isoform X2 [Phoenix dactylifera]|uniref:Uncharacterized protein LOC103714518 isoform X2 n=1 Tax=Phoenix dactylifera TaxID=42345 RepID=A0A8B8J8G1_PHODC|nr:uncharacterized protein LOC103714518 isoform X2 [Phoenix dactylifera]